MLSLLLLPITIVIINAETPTQNAIDITKAAIEYVNERTPKGSQKVKIKGVKRLDMIQFGNVLSNFANLKRYITAGNYVRTHLKECRGKNTCLIFDGLVREDGVYTTHYTAPVYLMAGRSVVCAPATNYRIIWSAVGAGDIVNGKDSRYKAEIVVAHEILHALGSWHISDLEFEDGSIIYRTNIMNPDALAYGLELQDIPLYSLTKWWIKGCYDAAREGKFSNINFSAIGEGHNGQGPRRRKRAVCNLNPHLEIGESGGH